MNRPLSLSDELEINPDAGWEYSSIIPPDDGQEILIMYNGYPLYAVYKDKVCWVYRATDRWMRIETPVYWRPKPSLVFGEDKR